MPYQLKMQLEGIEYDMISFRFETIRDADESGRPISYFRTPIIECALPFQEDAAFFAWVTEWDSMKDLIIEHWESQINLEDSRLLGKIKLKDVYLMSYRLLLDQQNPSPMPAALLLRFAARRISLNGRDWEARWPKV